MGAAPKLKSDTPSEPKKLALRVTKDEFLTYTNPVLESSTAKELKKAEIIDNAKKEAQKNQKFELPPLFYTPQFWIRFAMLVVMGMVCMNLLKASEVQMTMREVPLLEEAIYEYGNNRGNPR